MVPSIFPRRPVIHSAPDRIPDRRDALPFINQDGMISGQDITGIGFCNHFLRRIVKVECRSRTLLCRRGFSDTSRSFKRHRRQFLENFVEFAIYSTSLVVHFVGINTTISPVIMLPFRRNRSQTWALAPWVLFSGRVRPPVDRMNASGRTIHVGSGRRTDGFPGLPVFDSQITHDFLRRPVIGPSP